MVLGVGVPGLREYSWIQKELCNGLLRWNPAWAMLHSAHIIRTLPQILLEIMKRKPEDV